MTRRCDQQVSGLPRAQRGNDGEIVRGHLVHHQQSILLDGLSSQAVARTQRVVLLLRWHRKAGEATQVSIGLGEVDRTDLRTQVMCEESQDVLPETLQALIALQALGQSVLTGLQPTLGLLGQEVARGQEGRPDDQYEQQQRTAGVNGDGHAIRFAHRRQPRREQRALRGEELRSHVAYAIHHQLAAIGANGLQRAFRVARALQIDRTLQLGQLIVDHSLELAQLLLLPRVVGCQALQLAQLAREAGTGVVVGLQVALTARQEKSPLPRLGVLDARYQGIHELHDLHRMCGQLGALGRVVQRAVAEDADEQQSRDRGRKARQRPGRKQRTEAPGKGSRGLSHDDCRGVFLTRRRPLRARWERRDSGMPGAYIYLIIE